MNAPNRPLDETDLDQVFQQLAPLWEGVRDQAFLITGGTGFFGTWLLETLLDANRRLDLNVTAILLSRDPEKWGHRFPHLAINPAVIPVRGDVRSLSVSSHPRLMGQCDYIIHAAFDSGKLPGSDSPWKVIDTILTGTQRVLNLAEQCGVRKMLFVSSGAIYGKQPSSVSHLSECFSGGPIPQLPGSAYGEGKRAAELMTIAHSQEFSYESVIARGFAFIGPHLPRDVHFAAGNFLNDALNHRTITIRGDGTPLRSFLYAADMAIWLWTILFKGISGNAYNVGSSEAVSIAELAHRIAQLTNPPLDVQILKSPVLGQLPERYVPDVSFVESQLGLAQQVSLDEALRRTYQFYR